MSRHDTDHQLLFAVLVVQVGLARADQVLAAAAAGLTEPELDLGSRLVQAGVISRQQRLLVAAMTDEAVRAQGGDPGETLGLFGGPDSVARTFGGSLELSAEGELKVQPTPPPLPAAADSQTQAPVTAEAAGRYTLGSECGRGGQARVMLAIDQHIGREVAFKQLLAGSSASGSAKPSATTVARFLREARVTGLLEHPNIIPVHELGRRGDGSLYYTMRLVRGESLADRLESCETLDHRLKLLGAFWDLCNAVAFAHSKGVIHRDLKPANVMVGPFGETVLLDWGLAKVRGSEDHQDAVLEEQAALLQRGPPSGTMAGWAVGTPSYMSPEQARGSIEEVDERSDVWGLGAVLYELLTGRAPFIGDNPYHVVAQVRQEPVDPVAEHCSQAPPELIAVAQTALQRDRERRYPSAHALAEDVSAFMTGRRVRAYEYSSWELLKRFAARNRAAVVAAAAVLLTVLVALGAVFQAWQGATEARDQEHAQRLEVHSTLAQAYGLQADRLLRQQDYLRSRIFSAASLENNPANPAGPYHDPGFGLLHPGAYRLLVKSASRLYQAEHRPVQRLQARIPGDDALMDVAYSPDGRHLALTQFAQGFVVRDLERAEDLVRPAHSAAVTYGVAWFPDGQRLAVAGKGPVLQVFELGASQPSLVVEHPELRSATSVCVSPDGERIYIRAGLDGRSLASISASDGRLLALFPGHSQRVSGLALSPDGELLASSAYDDPIRLVNAHTGALVAELEHGTGNVYGLAFTPDSAALFSAATDGLVRRWDLATGQSRLVVERYDDSFYHVSISPDGRQVATAGSAGAVRLWSVEDRRQLAMLADHVSAVSATAFSPDGGTLASAGYDKTLRLWTLRAQEQLPRWQHDDEVYRLSFDPTGQHLATVTNDSRLHIWRRSPPSLERVVELDIHDAAAMGFSPDGQSLAVGGSEGLLQLRQVSDGGLLRSFEGHTGTVWGLDISPNGRWLASGSADQTARLWDLSTGELLVTMEDPDVHLMRLAFSHDSSLLAASGGTSSVYLWSVPKGELLRTLEGHSDWVNGLAWLPDGHQLVSGGRDGLAIHWDADAGTEIRRISEAGSAIQQLALDREGRRLATLDRDGTVITWQLDLGEPELWLLRDEGNTDMAFTPSGDALALMESLSVVELPMGQARGAADPSAELRSAEQDAALVLEGFTLVPAE